MEPKDRIAVLLAEYNTLRTEMLAARTSITQAIGIGAPVFVGLLPGGYFSAAFAVFLAAVFIAIWNDLNTRAFTAQIRTLESRINGLADERLLNWESEHGWGSIFPPPSNKDFRVPPH